MRSGDKSAIVCEAGATGSRGGFTLIETLVASSILVLLAVGVMSTFVWCGRQVSLCSKSGWSQNEAFRSSSRLSDLIRNASAITAIDGREGQWVRLRFTNQVIDLVYTNSRGLQRDGRMLLRRTNGMEVIVAKGMTEIMQSDGNTTRVFSSVRSNELQLAYRISDPVGSGSSAVDDGPYACSIRLTVCLRNYEEAQ